MRELLSVIVPCYNEGAVIERTAKAIVDTCTGRAFDFEIIFVNDGSKDDTLAFLKKLAGRSEKIKAGTLEKRQQCFPGWNIAREVVQ